MKLGRQRKGSFLQPPVPYDKLISSSTAYTENITQNTELNTEQHLSQTPLITGILELKIFKKENCVHVFYFIPGIGNGKNLDRFHLIIHVSVKCITSPQDRALEWL